MTTPSSPGLDVLRKRWPSAKQLTTGQRSRPAAALLDEWQPQMATFGITRLADVDELDLVGVPVVQAIRPNARSLSVSQGKGVNRATARLSALLEGAELWHAENCPVGRRAARGQLVAEGARVVDLDRMARQPVPDSLVLDWVAGTSLITGEPCWVPHACVSMDETPPRDPLLDHVRVTSAGLATGAHPFEALAHGLFELVERDTWNSARRRLTSGRRPPRLDPDGFDDAEAMEMIERCRTAGLTVVLSDITDTLTVPTVLCDLVEYPPNPFRPMPVASGLGCHVDTGSAIRAAVAEAVQSRLTTVAASRDDIDAETYGHLIRPPEPENLRSYLEDESALRTGYAQTRDSDLITLLDDLVRHIEAVRSTDVIVVELTRSDVGLPVVRVVCPGLEAHG